MRLVSVVLLTLFGASARLYNGKSRHDRSIGISYENALEGSHNENVNPFEVVSLDGRSPIRFHHTPCGKVLREITVLQPMGNEFEYTLKRILIEDDTGKPASGLCAEQIIDNYEREDRERGILFLRKRESGTPPLQYPFVNPEPAPFPGPMAGDYPYGLNGPYGNYGPYAPPPMRPGRKCSWIKKNPEDPNPFRRRQCRRREVRPCGDKPWNNEVPCTPSTPLPSSNFGELTRPREDVIPLPVLPPMPRPSRRCANRGPGPAPLRRRCRNRTQSPLMPHLPVIELDARQKVKREHNLDVIPVEKKEFSVRIEEDREAEALEKLIDLTDEDREGSHIIKPEPVQPDYRS